MQRGMLPQANFEQASFADSADWQQLSIVLNVEQLHNMIRNRWIAAKENVDLFKTCKVVPRSLKCESPIKQTERTTGRHDRARQKQLDKWVAAVDSIGVGNETRIIRQADMNEIATDSPAASPAVARVRTVLGLMETTIPCSFSQWLWKRHEFQDHAKLSVFGELESCFDALSNLSEEDDKKFSRACRVIVGNIMLSAFNLRASKADVRRSYMMHIVWIQQDDEIIHEACRKLPSLLKDKSKKEFFMRLIVDYLSRLFLEKYHAVIDEWLEQMKPPCNASGTEASTISLDVQKKEVQLYFGWAMSRVIKHYEQTGETSRSELLFVDSMSMDHNDAITDPDYLQKSYPPIVELLNRGGLTLVAAPYFDFGMALLEKIRESFSLKTIETEGTECIKVAYEALDSDEDLCSKFVECNNEYRQDVGDDFIKDVYQTLMTKTFHARAGVVTDLFKQMSTSRYAEGAVDVALREGLKILAKRNPLKQQVKK
jgi:hypothetical protein